MYKSGKRKTWMVRSGKPKNSDSDKRHDVQKLIVWSEISPRLKPRPNGPRPGACFTTRQFVAGGNLTNQVGLTSGAIQISGATAVLGAMAFTLQDCPQVSTFSSMFDQYRFEKVVLRVTPRNPAFSTFSLSSPNNLMPRISFVVDRDDASAPASTAALQEYDNCISITPYQGIDITLIPSLTPAIFGGGVFSGYSVEEAGRRWIDIANPTVPHYGVKYGIPGLQVSTSNSWTWDVELYYYVSFKNTR